MPLLLFMCALLSLATAFDAAAGSYEDAQKIKKIVPVGEYVPIFVQAFETGDVSQLDAILSPARDVGVFIRRSSVEEEQRDSNDPNGDNVALRVLKGADEVKNWIREVHARAYPRPAVVKEVRCLKQACSFKMIEIAKGNLYLQRVVFRMDRNFTPRLFRIDLMDGD